MISVDKKLRSVETDNIKIPPGVTGANEIA